jgi:hypothetical protein
MMNDKKFSMPDYLWKTADEKTMWISTMNIKHIINTLKMLQGKGKQQPPDIWQGRTKEEWIMIFNDELDYRRTKYIFD